MPTHYFAETKWCPLIISNRPIICGEVYNLGPTWSRRVMLDRRLWADEATKLTNFSPAANGHPPPHSFRQPSCPGSLARRLLLRHVSSTQV